ncbi:DNA-binding transcriptional regulator, LysR family [Amycolatopsis tolypomycina]|uniref:DNA-binding transcriptional regulator, LysR family n=1 Tax=Amycolatopsis tolypomycina TaxID=208445 RepID=A0A1H4W2P2_9PSEU|nr:LysR family transcriptional regulator [Amycolatopsis tolypomycina]SEC86901.1 DNA-binding transcriptional regulator, LysR family [Amycolatopsis tolypomycina]
MELRQLAVVVAVAEEGGFTAAAQRLRTVQSTVSTVVRALERDLGTPLFHRTTHRVVLTPAGEAFVPAARAALEAAERARAAVSPVTGRVRLGVCPGLLADLHRTLAALRHAHPGLAVEVRQVRCAPTESTVDLVMTSATGEIAGSGSSADLVTTLLAAEELVLATAPGGARSAPADLSALSLVDFPSGWAIRDAVDRAFPHRLVALEVDDLAVAAGLVRAGLAACVLPASVAARFPELTVRRFDRPPPWQLAAVYRADSGPAVAAVLAQLGSNPKRSGRV